MADTTYLKKPVESYVRDRLAAEFGIAFSSQFLTLASGGKHEFDAVSVDHRVVASIKSSSGKTSGGKLPSGKLKNAVAEIYFLSLVVAPLRLLVLTNPEFHLLLAKHLQGRLAEGITLKLVELPSAMQKRVREIQRRASEEVAGPKPR